MDYLKIGNNILRQIKDRPNDVAAYEDYFALCVNLSRESKEDFKKAHKFNKEFNPIISSQLRASVYDKRHGDAEKLDALLFKNLVFSAPEDFDFYLQAVEYGKPFAKKFYAPRRHYLKRYVDGYQKVLDGELDFLSISMPKRCGKSQLGINFVNMLSGKFPDKSTLMEGTGDALIDSFYKGCLEYMDKNSVYHYYDIFPDIHQVTTHSDIHTINLNEKSRFPTVMCRSIDSSQVGLSEATNLLYLDDCVQGREEAKNRQRLDDKWEKISGDIVGRAIEGTPIVICGTRYSLYDPIGRLQETMIHQNKRMMVLETPALSLDKDESNFEYVRDGKKVFTTQYFRDQREMLTAEQFESEFQQTPFEAKGLLFNKDELNYFFELPVDKDPDFIISVCDTADSGSDSCSSPIAYIYGEDVFLPDVVFDDSPAEVVKPQIVNKYIEHKVGSSTFESNNAGSYFAKDVDEELKARGYRCSILTKRTISNKQTRIEFAAPNIIKHFYFKHPSTYPRNSQYAFFMKEVTTYTRSGKVPHDDAPDSLSLLENVLRTVIGGGIEIVDRNRYF